MKKNVSLKSNIVFNSLYNILVIIVPLLVSPHLARAVGVEGVGIYSFSYAVSLYFRRTALLGVEKHGSRSIALVRDNSEDKRRTFWGIYTIQALSGFVCILVYILYLFTVKHHDLAAIVQIIYISSALFEVNWYYFGSEEFRSVVLIMGLAKILYLVSTYVFIHEPTDIYLYIAFVGLSHLLPGIVLFIGIVIRERLWLPSKNVLASNLKGMAILFIPVIAVTVYKSMDKLMIGILCDTSYQNGLYENAEKILSVPMAIMTAVSGVMMPRMTKLYRDNKTESAESYIDHVIFFGALTCMGCAFGMAAISDMFSVVYWGKNFLECGMLLRLFAVSIPFMCLAEVLRTQYIIPKKKDSYYIIAVCIGAVVNLIINALLIPGLGAKGAVVGTIVAEAAVCIYQSVMVRKELNISKYLMQFLRYCIPGLVMYILLSLLQKRLTISIVNMIVSICAGVVIYGVMCAIEMALFEKNRFLLLKRIIKK